MTCADDLVFFSTAGLDFSKPGFTCFGIRNTVALGERHGVFVLEPSSALENAMPHTAPAARYLEKPPRALMLEAGAILEGDECYTDSDFLFDRATALKLLSVLDACREDVVSHEVDAYGDFLHALGSQATTDYIDVDQPAPGLRAVRLALAAALKSVPLQVCVLNPGVFIHIGTMPEYLEHLTRGLEVLGGKRHLLNGWTHPSGEVECASPQWPETCILHSIIESPKAETVGKGCVVEFCRFAAGASIGFGSIGSGLRVPAGVKLPSECFQMTTAVCPQNTSWAKTRPNHVSTSASAYVTPMLNVRDNPKGGIGCTVLGVELGLAFERLGLTEEQVWQSGPKTLWSARIFPVKWSPEDSLMASLETLQVIQGIKPSPTTRIPRASLAELVKAKDLTYEVAFYYILLFWSIILSLPPTPPPSPHI